MITRSSTLPFKEDFFYYNYIDTSFPANEVELLLRIEKNFSLNFWLLDGEFNEEVVAYSDPPFLIFH